MEGRLSLFSQPSSVPFVPNSRANRLEKFAAAPGHRGPGVHWVYLCGPDEVASQILRSFPRTSSLHPMPVMHADKYTHLIHFPDGLPWDALLLADLLKKVLTLTPRSELDFAVVLDWYKVPPTEEDNRWSNTGTGELVQRGKYWGESQNRRAARDELARRMVDAIKQHPVLRSVDQVVTCPGHLADGSSFSEWLAIEVAADLGKSVVSTHCVGGPRPSRKDGPINLAGAFSFPVGLSGSVLIIDDVYQSGTTMGAVADSARRAGAYAAYGFAPVRTHKS